MRENRIILGLSTVGACLMVLGILLLTVTTQAVVGVIALFVGLLILAGGWYRFVESQRKRLWSLGTELRNLRERQDRLVQDLEGLRLTNPTPDGTNKYALDAVRTEHRKFELKLREMERIILSYSQNDSSIEAS